MSQSQCPVTHFESLKGIGNHPCSKSQTCIWCLLEWFQLKGDVVRNRNNTAHKKKANGGKILLSTGMKDDDGNNTTTQRGRLPFGLTLQVRDWLSASSAAQAAAEPTISTDSDFLGNLSDTLFSGEDLHMSAWGQRGKAGRKRKTVLVVTFLISWSWTSKKTRSSFVQMHRERGRGGFRTTNKH